MNTFTQGDKVRFSLAARMSVSWLPKELVTSKELIVTGREEIEGGVLYLFVEGFNDGVEPRFLRHIP